jgi:hypothetical protein
VVRQPPAVYRAPPRVVCPGQALAQAAATLVRLPDCRGRVAIRDQAWVLVLALAWVLA